MLYTRAMQLSFQKQRRVTAALSCTAFLGIGLLEIPDTMMFNLLLVALIVISFASGLCSVRFFNNSTLPLNVHLRNLVRKECHRS